jgi:hypothetical protein
MRIREQRVIITFASTTNAMAMEKICKEEGTDGRLIPVPRCITAGCGLSWSAKPQAKVELLNLKEEHNLKYENIYEFEI